MILLSKKVTPFLVKRVVFVGMNVYCWHVFVRISSPPTSHDGLLQHKWKKWQILTHMYSHVFVCHSNVAVWTRMYPHVTRLSLVVPVWCFSVMIVCSPCFSSTSLTELPRCIDVNCFSLIFFLSDSLDRLRRKAESACSLQQNATFFGEIKDVMHKLQNCEHVTKYHMKNTPDFA